jgi:hypothetical protein
MPPTRLTQTKERAWFAVYYQMGLERSLEKLADYATELGLKVSAKTLKRWSSDFGWQARLAEMDEKTRQKTEDKVVEPVVEMNLRHVTLAKALGGLASAALMDLRGRLVEVSAGETARMLEVSQKMERLAVGEVTDRTEIQVSILNVLLTAISDLFLEVNLLPDPQQRIDRFAVGVDEAVDKFLPQGREASRGA